MHTQQRINMFVQTIGLIKRILAMDRVKSREKLIKNSTDDEDDDDVDVDNSQNNAQPKKTNKERKMVALLTQL